MKGSSIVTGRRGELMVIGKLLESEFIVYTPVADVGGIDCVIKNDRGRLIEIQIKTRNKRDEEGKHFRIKEFKPHKDFFICCYLIDTNELWVIPSFVFYKLAFLNNYGYRVLPMNLTKRRILSKYKDDLGLGLLRLPNLKNK